MKQFTSPRVTGVGAVTNWRGPTARANQQAYGGPRLACHQETRHFLVASESRRLAPVPCSGKLAIARGGQQNRERAAEGEVVMSRWPVMVVALALAAMMAMLIEARAEDYPTRNVTILIPFAPGGGTDLLARAYAQILEKKYGKTFVVENRPGGGTTIAATATANATPDGYTLMQGTSGTSVL